MLLSQIGVFAVAVIGAYIWIAWRVLLIARTTGNDLHAAAAFGLLTMVATGLFQEEAYFAPLALAMFMALAGMIVGAAGRSGLLDPPSPGRQRFLEIFLVQWATIRYRHSHDEEEQPGADP